MRWPIADSSRPSRYCCQATLRREPLSATPPQAEGGKWAATLATSQAGTNCDSLTKLIELIYFAPQLKTLAASLFWLSLNIVGIILQTRLSSPLPRHLFVAGN